MSEQLKVAHIEFTDRSRPEEIRGFEMADYSRAGIVAFIWPEGDPRSLVVPLHRVASISHSVEEYRREGEG